MGRGTGGGGDNQSDLGRVAFTTFLPHPGLWGGHGPEKRGPQWGVGEREHKKKPPRGGEAGFNRGEGGGKGGVGEKRKRGGQHMDQVVHLQRGRGTGHWGPGGEAKGFVAWGGFLFDKKGKTNRDGILARTGWIIGRAITPGRLRGRGDIQDQRGKPGTPRGVDRDASSGGGTLPSSGRGARHPKHGASARVMYGWRFINQPRWRWGTKTRLLTLPGKLDLVRGVVPTLVCDPVRSCDRGLFPYQLGPFASALLGSCRVGRHVRGDFLGVEVPGDASRPHVVDGRGRSAR